MIFVEAAFFILRFQQALLNYGVDDVDIFQTNDLSEKRDMGSVTNTMFALGRAVSIISIISNNENASII